MYDDNPERVDELLRELHTLAGLLKSRNAKILEARQLGATVPEIAGSCGLDRVSIHRILAGMK